MSSVDQENKMMIKGTRVYIHPPASEKVRDIPWYEITRDPALLSAGVSNSTPAAMMA
jgi:hypothetical protein